MSLRFDGDAAAAAWLGAGGLGRDVSATLMLGPSGFEAYARILALPDPSFPGQAEADLDDAVIDAAPTDMALVDRIVATVTETTHDDELFFLLWEGWPYRPPLPVAPTVEIGGVRRYVLASGTRTEWLAWAADLAEGGDAPSFVWPTDHRWCVAYDIDAHFAGVGGSRPVINDLLARPALGAVAADRGTLPPLYA